MMKNNQSSLIQRQHDWSVFNEAVEYLEKRGYEHCDNSIYIKPGERPNAFGVQISLSGDKIHARFIDAIIVATEGKWIDGLNIPQFQQLVNNLEAMNEWFDEVLFDAALKICRDSVRLVPDVEPEN